MLSHSLVSIKVQLPYSLNNSLNGDLSSPISLMAHAIHLLGEIAHLLCFFACLSCPLQRPHFGDLIRLPILGLLVTPHSGVIIRFISVGFFMSDDQNGVVTLKVRVNPEFREKIVATAKENNRSMNQEIVSRLEASFGTNTEMDEFIIFLENSLKEKPNNESNKILINLFKEWLKFKKAP